MGKEAIVQRIISDAEAAAAAAISEAEQQAAEIIAQAEERANREKLGTQAVIAEKTKAIKDGKAAAARLDSAKILLAEKRRVIDALYGGALEKLKNLGKTEALALAENLLSAYAEEGDEIVFATDYLYKSEVAKLPVVAEKKLKVLGKTADICGGFVLLGKNSDKDLSYKALLSLDREARQAEIAAKIFL